MKLSLYSLYLGGILHLGWAGFHLAFPRLFKWNQALPKLDFVNRTVFKIIAHCLTFVFLAVGFITLLGARDLADTRLGHCLTAAIAAFWLFRLALQVIYFKLNNPVSLLLAFLFALSAAAYALPLINGVIAP